MRLTKTVKSRTRVWVGITLLIFILMGVLLFPRAGQFLVAETQFAHADIALILSGDPVRRALAARDLYLQDIRCYDIKTNQDEVKDYAGISNS